MLDQVPMALGVADQLAGLVALVRSLATAEVDNLTAALDPADLDRSWDTLAPPTVARLLSLYRRGDQQGCILGTTAAQLWTPIRTALSTLPAPGAAVPTALDVMQVLVTTVLGETKTRIGQGATIGEAKEHARLRGGRATAGMGADTTHSAYQQAVHDGGMAWARVPTGQACPFCLLMASRGPVYHTEQTATGSKGHYHPWDRCRAIAVPKGADVADYMPDDVAPLVQAADESYREHGNMDDYLGGDFAKAQNASRREVRASTPPPKHPHVPAGTVLVKGSGKAIDRHHKSLADVPVSHLAAFGTRGGKVVMIDGPVTDEMPHLQGVTPRGWDDDQTWDIVPGCYDPVERRVIAGDVPPHGGHGSLDLLHHELGHGLDDVLTEKDGPLSTSPPVRAAYSQVRWSNPYFLQEGEAGLEEAFAESYAASLLDEDSLARWISVEVVAGDEDAARAYVAVVRASVDARAAAILSA